MAIDNISQDLADLLVTRNFGPKYTDEKGQDSAPGEAKTFSFDYTAGSGKNYGTAVVVLGDDNDLSFFFGDNLGKSIEDPSDKDDWFAFLQELSNFATQHRYTFSPKDLNRLKHTMVGMAAIKEGLFEGYYGTRRVSYVGEQTDARLVIKHNRMIGEDDKRYRYVESLFIETADNERFKLPFTKLSAGRAMLEHVKQGGRPYDIRGQHINEVVQEMAVLSRFNRASQQRVFEGITQELVESAQYYYASLQENLKSLARSRGYSKYFESWTPADISDQTALVEDLKTMFIEQTIDVRIEAALPTLARIQQRGIAMKEAQIFENWINNLSEGTWALPETPEQRAELEELMSKELIVGPDATNATEQLYDLVGDDELFDILSDLAQRSEGRANCWDDSDVQQRLAELGIQMPDSAEDQADDAAVPGSEVPAQSQGVAEGLPQTLRKVVPGYAKREIDKKMDDQKFGKTDVDKDANFQRYKKIQDKIKEQGVAEGQDDFDRMLKLALVPIKESVLTDDTGHTMDHIMKTFGRDVRDFENGGDMSDDLYHALYDYYEDDMPYGTRKARDGDPYEWVSNRFAEDFGVNESNSGMIMPEADVLGTFESEVCNETAQGEYCPEHGLMECGGMYEMGTVAGGMAPVIGEAPQEVINYTESREGDHALARIKSLALLR